MTAVLVLSLLAQDDAVKKLIAQGDALYAKRAEEGMPAKAAECYRKALALDEKSVDACCRLARVAFWVGTHEKESLKAAEIYREAVDYCKLAVSVDAESTQAHFWLGVMYGLYGQARGILQSLHMIEPMKRELDWVLKKDEGFEQAAAHRVLAQLYFKLPGVQGGDNAQAIRHLDRAIELAPGNILNYLYLAEVQRAEHRPKEALEALKKLEQQPDDPDWAPEYKEWREQAKRLRETIEKE